MTAASIPTTITRYPTWAWMLYEPATTASGAAHRSRSSRHHAASTNTRNGSRPIHGFQGSVSTPGPPARTPRLNALSFWLLPIAGIMFLTAFLWPGGAFAAGWTGYAPLSSTGADGNVFFQMGVQWAGASSIMTALNFLVTIITMRAPGMTFWRMPLLVWANFTTSLLVVIATPFIAGSQFFALFDRLMHTNYFNVAEGGYTLGYQHIFWFYSHPAVYIMMLPGFGIISEVIAR